MSKYTTMKEVKKLKKELKNVLKEAYNIVSEDELDPEDKEFLDRYNVAETFKNETNDYNKLTKKDHKRYNRLQKMLDGDKPNRSNTEVVTTALKEAYTNYYSTKPRWFQLTKLFAHWRAYRAIKSFENELYSRGVNKTSISLCEYEVVCNKKALEELNSNSIEKKNQITIDDSDKTLEPKEEISLNNGLAPVYAHQLGK